MSFDELDISFKASPFHHPAAKGAESDDTGELSRALKNAGLGLATSAGEL